VIRTADAGAAPVKRATGALDAIDAASTPRVVDDGTGTAGVLLLYCVSKPVLVNVAFSCSLSLPVALWFPDSGTSPVVLIESTAGLVPAVELGVEAEPGTDSAPVAGLEPELELELELSAAVPSTVQFSTAASDP
jgi:hypothetical protein